MLLHFSFATFATPFLMYPLKCYIVFIKQRSTYLEKNGWRSDEYHLMMLCIMTLQNFPPFVGPNIISDGPITHCRYIIKWM